jgi:CheY-like chemotaxis protein
MEKNISVFELDAGMKLSKPVYVEGTHIILINKDVTLDASNIDMLQQLGIIYVFIYDDLRPAGAADPKAQDMKKNWTPPAHAAGVKKSAVSSGKILVVDDEPEICLYIKEVLENSGYTVLCANGASEALQLLTTDEAIDTLFLDLMMPEVSGLELLKKVRDDIKRDINAVIVTAKKSMQDIILAKELGISGYLTKPFDPGKLVKIANQAANEKKTM